MKSSNTQTPPHKNDKPRFAVFDIDGTLIRWQLYHAIVNQLAKAGHINESAYQQIRKSRMQWKMREHPESFKNYEHSIVTAYHEAITHLDVDEYNAAVDSVFAEHKDQVYTYTRDLITSLKQNGYLIFAISGSQIEVISKLADYYGFTDAVGNTYEIKDGAFTGVHRATTKNKHITLDTLVQKHGADYSGSIAVGDSESDIPMLEAVEQPIAFNPSQGLLDYAKEKGWKIVVERKNVIYELTHSNTGYRLQS